MDELWGHYAKLNKSVRERQMLYDLTYIQNLKKKKKNPEFYRYREQTGSLVVARGGQRVGGGQMDGGSKMHKLLVIKQVLGV